MCLSVSSTPKIAGFTDSLSRLKIGEDIASRIASHLEEQQSVWRERSLREKAYPYLYLGATYLNVGLG